MIPTLTADKRLSLDGYKPHPGVPGAFYGRAKTQAKGTEQGTTIRHMASSEAVVEFFLTHLPHIVAPLLGMAFLGRFAVYVKRLPPSHLSDEELAEWHARRAKKT
jgi:hypothetical protein